MKPAKKKSSFKRGFKSNADKKAIELRKALNLDEHSPLCAFDLCNHLNIPIKEPSDIPGLTPDKIEELLVNGSKHWSAASIPLDDNKYWIIHNPVHSSSRQQSNIMHELAHIICGHKISDDKLATGLSGFLRNHDDEQEEEANWLGACLQLPKSLLLWALKRKMSHEQIAEYCNASLEMVRYRINITGVSKQIQYYRN